MKASKHLPFWLITIAVLIALPGYTLIQDGMFMDAMLYTSVAHNEAQGIGNFWFPQFSKLNLDIPGFNSFHEQPPLVFGIQSVFFRIFGDSMYVERFYVFLTTCITAILIHLLWSTLFRKEQVIKKLSWLPIFLWITTPTIFWAASNNVHENTMGIFILASVLCSYTALQKESGSTVRWILAGMFIFLATLSKGFPGFFPLCVPLGYWLFTRKISFRKAIIFTLIPLLVILAIYGLLFQFEAGKESLSIYLFKRAFQRIASAPTTSNRFQSLKSLFMDLLPQLGLLLIIFLIGKWKKITYQPVKDRKIILFFMMVGLAGSVPLMLTMVQKAFYLIPCFPYFAIAVAMIMTPYVIHFLERKNVSSKGFRLFKGISVLLLCGSVALVMMMKGKTGRDRNILHDVYTVRNIIPSYSAITITRSAFSIDWELQCYLMRYCNISGDFKPGEPTLFLMIDKTEKPDRDLTAYRKMDIGLERYDLYKLK